MPMDADEPLSYLAAPKLVTGPLVWKGKGRLDYGEAVKIVTCPAMPEFSGQLRLTAHKTRLPAKYGFSLLIGSGRMLRVIGLDVNPATSHFNSRTAESVRLTHWQTYPDDHADVDERSLNHFEWLELFLARANIKSTMRYREPPREDVQMSML